MKNLVKYKPWILLKDLPDEINQLLDTSLAGQSNDGSKMSTNKWSPHVDVKEDKDKFIIYADVPGVDPQHLEVNIENNALTIKGERNCENRNEQDNYSRIERVSGSFYRRFTLPENIDETKVDAKGRNGVLTITIPKKEPNYPKKITVNIDGDS